MGTNNLIAEIVSFSKFKNFSYLMNREIHFPCLLFLYCLFATVSAFSEIKTIHSLDEISTSEFSKNTLVMFDRDDVLLYPQDA